MRSLIKNVTSAGTAEALSATSLPVTAVIIRAKKANTGSLYVGGASVDNTAPALEAGESVSWSTAPGGGVEDLSTIYIDVSVSGEGADVWYV